MRTSTRGRKSPEELRTPAVTVSIVVPTWRRPQQLRDCLQGIMKLEPPADEVVVVTRNTDESARSVVAAIESKIPLVERIVDRPGVLAALEVGASHARRDIVAFIDDDAVPRVDWLKYLLAPYTDPSVGAVGGKDTVHERASILHGSREQVGLVSWFGRAIGNHHLGVGTAREVDHLKGVNMSFRRPLVVFPRGLRGKGAQVGYELAMSLAVRRRGYKVIYDPRAQVDHYPGPRFDEDGRTSRTLRAIEDGIFNETFILCHFDSLRVSRLLYGMLVGDRGCPGLLRSMLATLQDDKSLRGLLLPSLSAQWQGWRAALRGELFTHQSPECPITLVGGHLGRRSQAVRSVAPNRADRAGQ